MAETVTLLCSEYERRWLGVGWVGFGVGMATASDHNLVVQQSCATELC